MPLLYYTEYYCIDMVLYKSINDVITYQGSKLVHYSTKTRFATGQLKLLLHKTCCECDNLAVYSQEYHREVGFEM